MLRKTSACLIQGATSHSGMVGALVLFTVTLGGCSADVGRFDFSSVGSTSDPGSRGALTPSEPLRRNAGIPVDNQVPSTYQRPPGGVDRTPAGGPREPEIRMSSLPDTPSREPPVKAAPRASAPPPAAGRQITTAATAPGETIEVQTGDTLYGIAKRNKVPVADLMALNNLQNPSIRPGQKLSLPAGKRAVAPRPAAVAAAPVTPADAPAAAPVAAPVQRAARAAPAAAPAAPIARPVATTAPAPADWSGSYTVAQGDSLYGIAKKHSVRAADLQSINSIAEPTKVRPGTVLKVPGAAGATAAVTPVVADQPSPAAPVRQPAATGAKPTIINAATEPAPAAAPERVAALGSNAPTKTDAAPAAAATPKAEPAVAGATGKFRWPVKGKVITGFGPRPDNTHNDGVNISVPAGTDVLAAEAGTIAYAGSELKGYGNLILVRHEGNWVSAYAHNDQLLVKRGDKVKRGQSIAKSGNTGTVDQPQVHFELRQGSKPVDPIPYMEKN